MQQQALAEANAVIEHIPRLRRYARTLAPDHDAVDDLVQDTLERALNKLHLWRPNSDMRAWLFSIMYRVFVNQWHRTKPEVECDLERLPDVMSAASRIDAIELAAVESALKEIPPEQREVLLLVAVEQMSYDEIATALSIPIGTVMSRLSRARERLRLVTGRAKPA